MQPPLTDRLALLYRISQDFNSSLDLDEVLNRVIDEVIAAVRAERGFLMLRDPAGQLRFRVARGIDRHTLEQPQFRDFGASQGERLLGIARVFDARLASRPWMAGDRFTIADITAFCGIEFAKLMKFKPGDTGLPHLQAWRDRVRRAAERPRLRDPGNVPYFFVGRFQPSIVTCLPRSSVSWSSGASFVIVEPAPIVKMMQVMTFQISPGLEIPMSWVYSVIPISSVLMLLYLVKDTVRIVRDFSGPKGEGR